MSPSEASALFLRLFSDFFLSNPLYVGNRCSQELIAETRASAAYATVTLSSGADAASFLESMAQQADDHVDVCCQIPDEAVAADLTDPTMFGTTLLLSFSGLVENVPIDAVVKVMYKYKESNASHLVVIGPNRLQMSSCLQLLRCELPCRHTVATLVTELKRADEFKGESIHPGGDLRYSHGRKRVLDPVTSTVMGAVRTRGGGVTGDLEGIDCW